MFMTFPRVLKLAFTVCVKANEKEREKKKKMTTFTVKRRTNTVRMKNVYK